MKINTSIIFEKYDRNHNLLERQVQPCKSFVKQLWELMYVQAAQISYLTPRVGVSDAAGQIRKINAVSLIPDVFSDGGAKATLLATAPSGMGVAYAPGQGELGGNATPNFPLSWPGYMLRGEVLGICVGAGNTAVAPNDFRLVDRIFHGTRTAQAVAAALQTNAIVDDSDFEAYQTAQKFIGFVALRGFKLTSIKLKMYREGSPGTITLKLFGCSADAGSSCISVPLPENTTPITTGTTDGDTLTNISPGEIREFVLATPVDILPGTMYAMVLTAVGGSAVQNVHIRYKTATYNTKCFGSGSSVDGLVWNNPNVGTNFYYELWGTSQAEIEYGGCEIRNLTVANPNASFIISRNFYNNTGGAVTIEEVGIGAAAFTNRPEALVEWRNDAYPFLIARDVVAPAINLLDGQTLQVTYTPSVTV